MGVILAAVGTITDRFGTTYAVTRTPLGADCVVYYVHAGEVVLVARAILRLDKVASPTCWFTAGPIAAVARRP